MRRSRVGAGTVMLLALVLAGCGRDKEVNTVMDDVDSFTTDLLQAVETAPDPEAGVDAAQRLLGERGAQIKQRMASIKDVRGFQVNEATKKRLATSVTTNATKVMGLQVKYMGRSIKNPPLRAKLEKLGNDYNAILLGK